MTEIDRFRWRLLEKKAEEMIRFSCPICFASYELELQDLEDITVNGTVMCECCELIEVRHLTEAYHG